MLLTDRRIRETQPAAKPIKLSDGAGLFLWVQPNGSRWWRIKFFIHGVEKQLSLGVYPVISLKCARERREDMRRQVAEGIDLSALRKAEKRSRAPDLRSRRPRMDGQAQGHLEFRIHEQHHTPARAAHLSLDWLNADPHADGCRCARSAGTD
jgi:hypothetical protein